MGTELAAFVSYLHTGQRSNLSLIKLTQKSLQGFLEQGVYRLGSQKISEESRKSNDFPIKVWFFLVCMRSDKVIY